MSSEPQTNLATPSCTPSQAAQELLSRKSARKSLIGFTEYTNPAYIPAQHHEQIAAKLEAVARGEILRLMIFMPPRHGKSELASRRFPAWFLGQQPTKQIIASSYGADLANDFGREVRNIVGSPEYAKLFDVALSVDSQSANRWHTDQQGAYVAAGVGTAITGRGAHILLIDDPLKDREEADSEVTREKVWNWYTSTAYTRLMPGGAVVLIQTRWHDDDLAGRLIEAQRHGGDQWDILSMPAVDNGGKALWPEWYPIERLDQIKGVIGPRDWNSLYQQNPVPDTGDYFKRDWFRYYTEAPKHLRIYGASDYAVTEDGGDFTVHLVVGIDPNDNIYVLDMWRGQSDTEEWIEAWLDLCKKWEPLQWAEESGQIIKSVGPFIVKRQTETKVYTYRKQYTSAADKPTRARAIQARMSMGKVYFPFGQDMTATLERELLRFPAGKNDDQVDTLSLIGRMLNQMIVGEVPKDDGPSEFKDATNMTFADILARQRRKNRDQ